MSENNKNKQVLIKETEKNGSLAIPSIVIKEMADKYIS
jgi:hypothetical protein